jgi:EamA domain-containing membrane protein RarD
MSIFGKLNLQDIIKGSILAVITAIITALYQIVQAGSLPTVSDLQTIGTVALGAALSYLLKNWLTNSNGNFAKPEVK